MVWSRVASISRGEIDFSCLFSVLQLSLVGTQLVVAKNTGTKADTFSVCMTTRAHMQFPFCSAADTIFPGGVGSNSSSGGGRRNKHRLHNASWEEGSEAAATAAADHDKNGQKKRKNADGAALKADGGAAEFGRGCGLAGLPAGPTRDVIDVTVGSGGEHTRRCGVTLHLSSL